METPRESEARRSERSRRRSVEDPTRNDSIRTVTSPIQSVIQRVGIDKVYGSPITQGDTTVVPVAELRLGFGYGSGHGRTDHEDMEGGGGAGASLRMRPRGVIELSSDGVRYRPIYSLGTIAAGGAFLGWLLYRLLSR